jgi:hypothetical protein
MEAVIILLIIGVIVLYTRSEKEKRKRLKICRIKWTGMLHETSAYGKN